MVTQDHPELLEIPASEFCGGTHETSSRIPSPLFAEAEVSQSFWQALGAYARRSPAFLKKIFTEKKFRP